MYQEVAYEVDNMMSLANAGHWAAQLCLFTKLVWLGITLILGQEPQAQQFLLHINKDQSIMLSHIGDEQVGLQYNVTFKFDLYKVNVQ